MTDEEDNGGGAGDDLQLKLDTFRASNRELMQKNGAMEKTLASLQQELAARDQKLSAFGNNDPKKIQSALQLLNTVEDRADSELIEAGRFEEVVAKRIKPRDEHWSKVLKESERKLEAESAARQKAMNVASDLMLERAIRSAVAEKKLRPHPSAEDDLFTRARRDWKVSDDLDGNLVSANTNNMADDVAAWVDMQVEKAPHLWQGGSGGSAGSSIGKLGSDGVRVIKRQDIPEKDYAKVLREAKLGKVRIVS
jgi:hypothetical protein